MIADQVERQGNRSEMISYSELYKQCNLMVNGNSSRGTVSDDFVKLPSSALAHKLRDGCCNDDVPMKHRGFHLVERGFEGYGRTSVVKDLFDSLSESNRSLILLGDSMNNQVYNAMIEELKREYAWRNESLAEVANFNAKSEVEWTRNPGAFGLSAKTPMYIGAIATYRSRSGSKIYIYLIDFWYGRRSSAIDMHFMDQLVPMISSMHVSGILLLANIGHHLEIEREQFLQNQKHPLVQGIADFVNWLDDVSKLNKKNVVLFRETTPTYFNSPLHDGLYESFKLSGYSNINYLVENDWNDNIYDSGKGEKSLYYCHSFNKSMNVERPENTYVREILFNWAKHSDSYRSRVGVWSVYDHLVPFYKMSYGHCGGYNRIATLDCTHYCLWSPPMWIPLWADLLSLYEHRSKIASEGSESSGVPVGEYVKGDVKLIKSNSSRDIFVYYHGIKRSAKDMSDFEFEFGTVLDKNSAVLPMSDEDMDDIPLGSPVHPRVTLTEKSVVEMNGDAQLFYFVNGSRHSIPNWDTFCSLGVDKKDVIHLSYNSMKRIPVGSPLPTHDFPYVC